MVVIFRSGWLRDSSGTVSPLFPGPHLACLNAQMTQVWEWGWNSVLLKKLIVMCQTLNCVVTAAWERLSHTNTQYRLIHSVMVNKINIPIIFEFSHTLSNWKREKSQISQTSFFNLNLSQLFLLQTTILQQAVPYSVSLQIKQRKTCTHFCSASEEFGHLWCSLKYVILNTTPF